MTRRHFLAAASATLGVFAAGGLLEACGGATAPGSSAASPAVSGKPEAAGSFDQLLEAAKREGQVNLWTGSPNVDTTMQKLQEAFNKRFGTSINVQHVGLTAGEAASRVIAENQAGRHDGDMLQPSLDIASNLLDQNLAAKRDWQALFGAQLPGIKDAVEAVGVPELRGAALGYWDVVYVVLYNTSQITKDQLPKKWDDLAQPAFKGKLAVDVRGYPFNYLMLHPDWGADKTEKLVRAVNGQQPLKQQGAVAVSDAVARGDAPLGLGSIADTFLQKKKGWPVEAVVFDYVPLNPLMAFVPAQPAHPNASQLYAAWMTVEGVDILEAEESNGRLSKQGSPTQQAVYSQQPNPKIATIRSREDMKTSADFLKRVGEIFTGAR